MISRGLWALLVILGSGAATAQNAPQVVLVELFTSEGCSSCPPADKLLSQINGKRTPGGQLIVGLSEHVTYWNQLGWVDPFSDETYTARQSGYGDRFRLDSVYTPQMVVNGERQVSGGDGAAVQRAIHAVEPTAVSLKIDSSSVTDKELVVTFSVAGPVRSGTEIYAVIADDVVKSSVARGENSGRTLDHVAVARSMKKVATLRAVGMTSVSLQVPGALKGQPPTGRHLVLFAQESGMGRIVAVEAKGL